MDKHLETRIIHSHFDQERHYGSLTQPLYQTSTFVFGNAEEGERRFAGEEEGYMYTRLGNPTVAELEHKMADLEATESAVAFASGMGAVSAVLMHLLNSGDHVIVTRGVYGCTYGFLELFRDKYGLTYDLIHMDDESSLEQVLVPETKVIYVETPINPTMKVVDLEMVTAFAKKHGLKVVVDNTFSSPYLQQPSLSGADFILHSATKYISGHGDVIAGIVCGPKEDMDIIRMSTLKDIGAVLGPFDAWLLLRGIKTLGVRMDRHCENAAFLFDKLKQADGVTSIIYPGDSSFPDHKITQKQMRKPGGMISFEIDGGKKAAQSFLNHLKLCKRAVSLGDAETLIQHPASMTHAVVPEEERLKMGINDSLIRISAGLEHKEDIWADIRQSLLAATTQEG
ncbi:methionine gamma-lyase [Salisediminibacterium selenitireducens]|uniref:L-methionine gamma-lyase n=1 Tax=Bacillus selenitireducens (strain ATCC 700615 / DSM 15326 / MLS10) TaxID=439292 RepID=D6XUP6_BACIE|nr:methionine gamma-lyase [Salisediminibacterium selenitireducens]ADH99532.1 methionine gamma-lyase [[Bacillus] selenitireducens MLS10]